MILVVANWKMSPTTLKGAKLLFNSVKKGIKSIKNVKVVICPPFPYLGELNNRDRISIKLGAQDCFWQEKGAFTGEVSPKMLKDLGVEYVIIGHSERRRYFNETDEVINKKLKAALKAKLKPILCIGETEEEREKGQTPDILKSQIEKGLNQIPKKEIKNIAIAYEPVWAIGTGNPCQPQKAKGVLIFLRKILKNNPILYGGSVDSKNAKDYIVRAGFQGLLVGGASLNAKEFVKLIKNVSK